MSIPVLTFFNNKGGVGKTSLAYHLSWMLAELGHSVLALDLDPQANLTAAFFNEDDLERLWSESNNEVSTIFRALRPLAQVGDLAEPEPVRIAHRLNVIPGDVGLTEFEETLSNAWSPSMGDTNLYRPFRILSAFWQVAQQCATKLKSDVILVDVGPNLGAINRSALIATDAVLIPLGADLFSLQGLRNLGPALRSWRSAWSKRLDNWPRHEFPLPRGKMTPLGYVIQQHGVRLSRPVKAYDRWIRKIPHAYRSDVLRESGGESMLPSLDPYCLATLKHFRSLVPMAQEARKPIFSLTPADGAIGGHAAAVQAAREDFRGLAKVLLSALGAEAFARGAEVVPVV